MRVRATVAAIALLWGCVPAPATPSEPDAKPRRARAAEDPLAHVPDDTPWIVASLQPLPPDVMRRYERVWDAAMAGAQKAIDDVDARTLDPETLAIVRELDGRLSRDGLTELGFAPDGRFVLYGIGLAPVLRLPLSDPAKVSAMLDRIDAADRRPWPRVSSGGIELSRIEAHGTSVAWGVLKRELVVAAYPSALEEEILPLVTGTQMPARSLADVGWASDMRRTYGMLPFGLGRVDLQALTDAWLGRGPSLATATARAWGWQSDMDACDDAVRAAIARAPQLVFGATEMSSRRIAGRWVWTMDAALVRDLSAIAGSMPVPRDEGVASVAFAFDLDAAASAARGWIADLEAKAPGCPVWEVAEDWEPPDTLAGFLGGSATLHAPGRRTPEEPSYTLALGWNDPARWLGAVIGPAALADWPAGRAVKLAKVVPHLSAAMDGAFVMRTDRAVALASGARARAHVRQAGRAMRRDDDTLLQIFVRLGQLRRAIGGRALARYLSGLDPIERETTEAVLELLGDYEARVAAGDAGLVVEWGLDVGG